MIICRTPLRISLFGGGTDYPIWYERYGGQVLSATINKYSYITVRNLPPFFDYRYRIRYHNTEEQSSVSDILHPVVREGLISQGIDRPLEIVHTADLPARSGMGSSSTFSVGFLHTLYTLNNYLPTKRELAHAAIHLEQKILNESVGSQDQIAAAFGGFNHITFSRSSEFNLSPVVISKEKLQQLEDSLLLCFTGFSRTASQVAEEQVKVTLQRAQELNEIDSLCSDGLKILNNQSTDLKEIGRLLHEQWLIKKNLTNMISNRTIDDLYDAGLRAGAVGGKLLGAGGGGFLLFFVDPTYRNRLIEALQGFMIVPFRFEFSGSNIIYFTHD